MMRAMPNAPSAYAIALLRIVTGLLVASHGLRRLFVGPARAIGGALAAKGLPAPTALAWFVTAAELAGILLALGLFSRAAGGALAVAMALVVCTQTGALSFIGTGAGIAGEYPLLLTVVGLYFATNPPGPWALRGRR
jgi:uncharacterized membrane protein YphA (DoxX/SURF4 family)